MFSGERGTVGNILYKVILPSVYSTPSVSNDYAPSFQPECVAECPEFYIKVYSYEYNTFFCSRDLDNEKLTDIFGACNEFDENLNCIGCQNSGAKTLNNPEGTPNYLIHANGQDVAFNYCDT